MHLLNWFQASSPIVVVIVGGYISTKVKAVHILVNAKNTALENRIAQLEETIKTSNSEIPPSTRETGRV